MDARAVEAAAQVGLGELLLTGCTTTTDHLYLFPRGQDRLIDVEIKAARDKAERDTILSTLKQCQWNVTEASRRLGMDRGYLHRKIKRYGLVRESG